MHKKIVIFIIGIFITGVFFLFTWDVVFKRFEVLTRLNYIFYDINLKLFHHRAKSDSVVIVDVDEKSLQAEGRWAWPRSKVAAVVKNLQKDGAAVVVFDILFPEPEPNIATVLLNDAKYEKASSQAVDYLAKRISYFDNDAIFAKAIAEGDVVLGMFFSRDLYYSSGKLGRASFDVANYENLVALDIDEYIGNIPLLADTVNYTGSTSILPDEDGSMRRLPLFIKHAQGLYPSLSLEAVRAYLLTENLSLDLHDLGDNKIFFGVNLGDIYIPTDPVGNMLIAYRGPAFSFPYVSATDVLHNTFAPQTFAGKIVLIGSSAVGIGDIHSTPLQSVGYPGVEVHASVIASILDRNIISSPLWLVGLERILLVFIGLIFTILVAYLPALGLILSAIIMMFLMLVINAVLLVQWSLVLPHLMLPFLQILFLGIVNSGYGYLFETRYRRRLHSVYGQYVSSDHIDKMLELPDKHPLLGHTKVMTVLFVDIRNFTSVAEKLDAKEVKRFLNALFTPLTEIIFEFKGTIDKYVGDMIVAFWNDPLDDKDHAIHAVEAALMMRSKVKELAPVFATQDLQDISVRIGINTGMMHVGDMGSEYRKAYTVLGDAVNLASRLEGVNKMYGTDILVSQKTKEVCQNVVFRFIDRIFVKGREAPTNIYEPLCLVAYKSSSLELELTQYDEALQLYKASDWFGAKEKFADLTQKYPQKKIYQVYFERVSKYEKSPPPADWDHAQHLSRK